MASSSGVPSSCFCWFRHRPNKHCRWWFVRLLDSNLQVAKRLLRKSALTAGARKETEKLFAAWPRRRTRRRRERCKGGEETDGSERNLRGNVIWIAYTGRIVSQHL